MTFVWVRTRGTRLLRPGCSCGRHPVGRSVGEIRAVAQGNRSGPGNRRTTTLFLTSAAKLLHDLERAEWVLEPFCPWSGAGKVFSKTVWGYTTVGDHRKPTGHLMLWTEPQTHNPGFSLRSSALPADCVLQKAAFPELLSTVIVLAFSEEFCR